MYDFSVVIITWNRLELLKRAVNSIFKQEKSLYELIIVDNGNNNQLSLWLDSLNLKNINYIKLHKNLGVITPRNIGIANSKGKIVFLMDDDAYITDELLFYKIKEYFNKINTNAIGINILENDKLRINLTYPFFSADFFGGAVFFRKDIFEKIGFFEDTFFRESEEFDFILRMLEKKLTIYFIPDLFIVHEKKALTRESYSKILFYSFRNKSVTIAKNLPYFDRIIFSFWNNVLYFFKFLKIKRIDLFFKAVKSKNRISKENKGLITPISADTMKKWYYLMKYKPTTFDLNNNKITIYEYIFFKLKQFLKKS